MIEIATNKTFAENYAQKHNTDAKFGWYRYDTNNIPVHAPSSLKTQVIDDYNTFTVSVLYDINFLTENLRHILFLLVMRNEKASLTDN